MDLGMIIAEYGYVAVFLGTLLEGETWVALGGFAAYQGYLHLSLLIVIATIGAFIGDQTFFILGRYKGKSYLANHPDLAARVVNVRSLIEKHKLWLIFSSRFMYGFRAVLPVALGMSNVSHRLFIILNLLGAIVWANIFAFAGYMFGGAIETSLGSIKKFEGYLVLVIFLVIVFTQFLLWQRKRKNGDNPQ